MVFMRLAVSDPELPALANRVACVETGKSSNAASMGGHLNNAAFLGGSSYDENADYGDDVSRCTVDVSGSQIKSLYRSVPGTASSLPFLSHDGTYHPTSIWFRSRLNWIRLDIKRTLL